ncbi:sodium/calcium exchanger 2-like isoform X2 [Montipora foliosa]|uniref:sodium/calcium exchanger 2-like isoform X2 n=1 Tax=Montipora foliosa TaxID=591990 RepID=UPI0035F185B8
MMVYLANYSRGYVVEYEAPCFKSWLLLPAQNLWHEGLRGVLYVTAMVYIFLGIAIIADIFMSCIEVITSKKRKVTRFDPDRQERVEIEVFVWNETVANLTLMALGSSAPEILLAVVETAQNLGNEPDASREDKDGLGSFTIIGSASFNLLLITAICVVSVPSGTVKRIREFGVFIVTSAWSLFAYIWLLVVLKWSSPDEIELWEAFVTLSFFPLLVVTSWCQDNGWWCKRGRILSVDAPEVRVVGLTEPGSPSLMHRSMELTALEQQRLSNISENDFAGSKQKLRDVVNLWRGSKPDCNANRTTTDVVLALKQFKQITQQPQNAASSRARFRHAALRTITRQRQGNFKGLQEHDKDREQQLNLLSKSFCGSRSVFGDEQSFSFSARSYSVVKSNKMLTVEVQLNQRMSRSPSISPAPHEPLTAVNQSNSAELTIPVVNWTDIKQSNGGPVSSPKPARTTPSRDNVRNGGDWLSDATLKSDFENDSTGQCSSVACSVDYETRDGSAKHGVDYHKLKGTFVFNPGETRKSLAITLIHCEGYALEKDFYVLLKNPVGKTELGEPNLARITIIDDDEPGEFSFEQASYYANTVTADVTCNIIRRKGCDGPVALTYNTMNGTGVGGTADELDKKLCDFEHAVESKLFFQHGETSKQFVIRVNPNCQNKNFIVLLSDQSPGAKIGVKSAAVVNITNDVDNIVERVANIMTAEDQQSLSKTWRSQFEEAMVIQGEEDDKGNVQPLSTMDFLLHFLTFFWKVIFAFIPPRNCCGGWPAFVVSLLVIAALTALVEQLGKLLGCVVGLRNSVTGITIIAIGTSLPDTFASRSAALHDIGADASIGNITGSNSVNVFLGLGLPWVISTCYHAVKKTKYIVHSGNLTFSVVVFSTFGLICILTLVLRRMIIKGELGGSTTSKYLTGAFLVMLWCINIVLSSLMAYGLLPMNF